MDQIGVLRHQGGVSWLWLRSPLYSQMNNLWVIFAQYGEMYHFMLDFVFVRFITLRGLGRLN